MKPKIPQQLFKNESIETPKHDDMLLIFEKDGKELKKIITGALVEFTDVEKRTYRTTGYYDKERGIYFFDSNNPDVKEVKLTNFLLINAGTLEILWEPEKPIINHSYYVGSVDLEVIVSFSTTLISQFSVDDVIKELKPRRCRKSIKLLLEFKPKINSFSEVIRQVNVYKSYLKPFQSIVITYSDISKFKDIFETQGIKLIQLNQNEQ